MLENRSTVTLPTQWSMVGDRADQGQLRIVGSNRLRDEVHDIADVYIDTTGVAVNRRDLLAFATTLAATAPWAREAKAAKKKGVDWDGVAADIEALMKEDPNKGPTLVLPVVQTHAFCESSTRSHRVDRS
eukprot:1936753-Pyramimonas_sp.AAC.1